MKSIFIAELGLNAHGDFAKMTRMCARAAYSGASFIKGQYYNPEHVLGPAHPAYEYALKCQFTKGQHEQLAKFCEGLKVPYFVSVFDRADVKWADSFCPVHKIASRMNQSYIFIGMMEACEKPVFMSIQTKEQEIANDKFSYMWCVRDYPTEPNKALDFNFDYRHGFSSHCPYGNITVAAWKKGARVFENHVCEDRTEEGCDITSSIDFYSYKQAIDEIRQFETLVN